MTHPGIRQWKVDCGAEPAVRIGVVLAEDGMSHLQLQIPDAAYELKSNEGRTTIRAVDLKASLESNGEISVAGQPLRSKVWSITPVGTQRLSRSVGVRVKDVVAGRGFHWSKKVDQSLAGTIEIRAGKGGLILVNQLPLEMYLACVITSEMSGTCPIEFLRAQCITARSWLLAMTEPKHDNEPFDRCNDDCCQRYQGTDDLSDVAIEAATSTSGLILRANEDGRVVDANYSKSCGGIVELPEHVWQIHKPGLAAQVDAPRESKAHDFLPVTEDNLHEFITGDWINDAQIYCSPHVIPEDQLGQYLGRVDESAKYFRWTISYSHDELVALLRGKGPEFASITKLKNLRVTRRGISGRATEVQITYIDPAGQSKTLTVPDQYRIRQILHKSFLFSSALEVEIDEGVDGVMKSITLHGAGWGHGAGLCQIGALGMALKGMDHRSIVLHYFPEARLEKVY